MDTQKLVHDESKFWDGRYEEDGFAYGTEANEFLKGALAGLKPGTILLPAEGEGRNAVYAAQLGWDVDAIDFSQAGKDKALKLAQKLGVTINYEIVDISLFEPNKSYDTIAFIFMHLAPKERNETFRRYVSFLKPGGKLIVEIFSKQQLGNPSGGPQNAEWLVNKEELATLFAELDIELLEEVETTLHEGKYHLGKANTTRLIGTRR
jgi:SAM-dependent methyltransferase